MPAKMLAAAARFGRTDDAVAVPGNDEMGVFLYRRHTGANRYIELKPGNGD